ncbi:discoidin domain-containing protein [Myxococcota bacterium]|nr:discoidin domain-containing protein [Myxococcota bacterium]
MSPKFTLACASALLVALAVPSGDAGAAVEAKSYYRDPLKEEYTFAPSRAADGDPETGWIEGQEGDGAGEWLQLDVPKGEIVKLQVQTGIGKDAATAARYGRVKDATIELFSMDDDQKLVPIKQIPFTFQDVPGLQEIPIGGPVKVGSDLWGGKIRLTIRSSYKGTDFDSNVAVGDVLATFKEDTAPTMVLDASGDGPGGSRDALVDEDEKTAWIADGGVGQWIEVEAADWAISGVGLVPGNNKSPATWKANARVKDVEITVNGVGQLHTFADKPVMQWVAFPPKGGTNGGHYGGVKIEIKSVYPGTENQSAAISEVQIRAISFGG